MLEKHFASTSDWPKNIARDLLANHKAVLSFLFSLLFLLKFVFFLDADLYQLDFL